MAQLFFRPRSASAPSTVKPAASAVGPSHEEEGGEASETRPPAGKPAASSRPPLPGVFGTETVAELCVKQGRVGEAVAIFRRLLERKPDDARAPRWKERLSQLAGEGGPEVTPIDGPAPNAVVVPASPSPSAATAASSMAPLRAPGVASFLNAASAPPSSASPELARTQAAIMDARTSSARSQDAASGEGSSLRPASRPAAAPPWGPALVVREPVRSGTVIYAENRDLIVLAQVSSGAEIVADGHIHVYATLRGRAVAGARGNADALIYCHRLEAEVIGIDDAHLTAEELPEALKGRPVRVIVSGGQLQLIAC